MGDFHINLLVGGGRAKNVGDVRRNREHFSPVYLLPNSNICSVYRVDTHSAHCFSEHVLIHQANDNPRVSFLKEHTVI